MRRRFGGILLLSLACLVLLPAVVAAQSQINGVVRDESGGVLPGVTIEASSPVLIEKVRSAVSDDQVATSSSTCVLAFTELRSR
jgi:hypothetical protein